MKKRLLSTFLFLALCISLSGCGARVAEESPTPAQPLTPPPIETVGPVETAPSQSTLSAKELHGELYTAWDADLIPDGWLDNLSGAVTVAEFNKLLSTVVERYDPELLPEWEALAVEALRCEDVAQRDDAILSIFESAMLMGLDTDEGRGEENWEDRSTAEDWWAGRSLDYDYFPNWSEKYGGGPHGEFDVDMNAAWFVERHLTMMERTPIFEPTSDWTFGFDLDVTREEALLAVLRYSMSIRDLYVVLYNEERTLVRLDDAGTYDTTILTDELRASAPDLPEVSQSALPSDWRGAGISIWTAPRTRYYYGHDMERDIAFLAENGFNFYRLFFPMDDLRFPDNSADPRVVNTAILEKLDRILALCIRYGVHLQIAMQNYMDENGNNMYSESMDIMPQSEANWELIRDYWAMLARRYAGIDSRYLTFDLCNEVQPPENTTTAQFDLAVRGIGSVIAAIRAEDPDRVLCYGFQGNPNLKWAEALAEEGVALAAHPYKPDNFFRGVDGAPVPFELRDDGLYNLADGGLIDENYIYHTGIEPLWDIAQTYGVGFMVNEFGLFANYVDWDISLVNVYHEVCLRTFEEHQIGWCYCELWQDIPKHIIIVSGETAQWGNSSTVEQEYAYADGEGFTVRVCQELLDKFLEHTKT